MLLALGGDGSRTGPSPQARASCPSCRSPVIAKCGTQVVHHWAHEADDDCDPWSEGETRWHARWKERFAIEWREVPHGPHRADVRTPAGLVVEFQHSPIAPEEVAARDAWWRRVFWVFDCAEPYAADRLRINRDFDMEWDSPARSWLTPVRRPWLDLGDGRLWRPKNRVFLMDPPIRGRAHGLEGEGEIWTVESFCAYVGERGAVRV